MKTVAKDKYDMLSQMVCKNRQRSKLEVSSEHYIRPLVTTEVKYLSLIFRSPLEVPKKNK